MPEPLDARERRELCDLLGDLGPDAPTLCEGWATVDLAAHLVVRERHPSAGPGLLVGGPFTRLLERATAKALATGYTALVERVRNGPPLPMALPGVRTVLHLNEFAVHHEDVRRANGLGPRTDRADLQDGLWPVIRRGARLVLRPVRKEITVRLVRPDGSAVAVGAGPEVVVRGEPLELSLYLMGRKGVSDVEVSGDPGARQRLAAASLGV